MKTIFAIAALAAVASAPAAAQSVPAQQDVVRISFADLDLGSLSGRSALDRRIRAAVENACGTVSSSDPRGGNDVYRCRDELAAKLSARRDALLAARSGSGARAAR